MRMIQKYIYHENSKKIRAQECSDNNMISGMASTEKHKIKQIILIISQQDLLLIVSKCSTCSYRSVIWNKQRPKWSRRD